MKTCFIFIFIFSVFKMNTTEAQIYEHWAVRYNGTSRYVDIAHAITVDTSGNVYVTGESVYNSTPHITTVKYNAIGNKVWEQRFQSGIGGGADFAYAITSDKQGNIYIAGTGYGSFSSYDIITIKYNTDGIMQWIARYTGINHLGGSANAIVLDSLGNVFIAGYVHDNGAVHHCVTIKYNNSGVQQWANIYTGANYNDDQLNAIIIDHNGNAVVTGVTELTLGDLNYTTIKYSQAGVQMWTTSYNGPAPSNSYDWANGVVVDVYDNIYVTGFSQGNGTLDDIVTIKYDSDGVQQWLSRYDSPGHHSDEAAAIAIDNSGNVCVTGYTQYFGVNFDIITIKYDPSGIILWTSKYIGPNGLEDNAVAIAIDTQSNIYITGYSQIADSNYDYVTIKYNLLGQQQWIMQYDGPNHGIDKPTSMVLDSRGNVYVTGMSDSTFSDNFDYLTIKYSPYPIGIKIISSEIPVKFQLYLNYPNPFNPNTKIKFDIPVSGLINQTTKLIIYDLIGREITTLVNEGLKPGSYEVEWDASPYATGVYFYSLTSGDYLQTKKMVLIK